ncbi:MAG: T9SS type A sorting domain-containing protein, partial [Flavobacteriales bacterium]|nr:T9SS type A sorting domain-containing protein [Flavobacteriales bacterium]
EWIDYTIRFQNTGTAEALFVTITDTLPEELDMTSFQMALASHAHEYSFKPGRVVEWFFDDINLPDSTTDLAGSQGFVKFRIRPVQPVLAGTVIENIANIYFDFNPPVITEPSVLVAEFSTGVDEQEGSAISLAPVPASDELIVSSGDALANVRILAADGREVMRMSARSTRVRIDLNGLKSGAYLLLAELENGTMARECFIKQ